MRFVGGPNRREAICPPTPAPPPLWERGRTSEPCRPRRRSVSGSVSVPTPGSPRFPTLPRTRGPPAVLTLPASTLEWGSCSSRRAGDAPGGDTPHSLSCSSVRVIAMNTTAVSLKHLIGLVLVVVALVFGVTYTSMILGNKRDSPVGGFIAQTQLIQDGELLT